jgi:hypothetical protein
MGRRLENSVRERKDRKVIEGPKRDFAEGRFAKLELRQDIRTAQHGTSPWRRDIAIESIITVSPMPQTVKKIVMTSKLTIGPLDRVVTDRTALMKAYCSLEKIYYIVVYLFHQLFHREHFCKLYLSQQENALLSGCVY